MARKTTTRKKTKKKAKTKRAVATLKARSKKKRSGGSGKPWTLHIVSDSSGHLAGHLTRAILLGFEDLHVERAFHVFHTTPEMMYDTIGAIGRGKHLLVHAVAASELKDAIAGACGECGIPCLDLTGLSRVSKSPTSFLLGSMGLKTANVSLVREVDFPDELARVKGRVVALTIQPRLLREIRSHRLSRAGVEEIAYSDLQEVIREVMWAEEEYRTRGYPIIDITGRTIEQLTAEICKLLGLRRALLDLR